MRRAHSVAPPWWTAPALRPLLSLAITNLSSSAGRGCCGDTVGLLHDFDRIDLDPWEVRAGVDGIVIAQAWGATVLQGQHVLVTGRLEAFLTGLKGGRDRSG